jgi:mono/diheme cytochrome c family protein
MARFPRRVVISVVGAVVLLVGISLLLTRADRVDSTAFSGLTGNTERGERIFIAAGCASCHHAPGAKDDARLILTGGQVFETQFGRFTAPNVSPDPKAGIGAWSLEDFASALRFGTSPAGRHYYPVFPYTAYTRMTDDQIADLWSYFQTLPQDGTSNAAHDLKFPFSLRAGIGLWKSLYLNQDWVLAEPESEMLRRGRTLVEALGHCGECHTPRNVFGGLKHGDWFAGGPNPTGTGTIPALTPDHLDWSENDISYYLETGFTPDFDSAGGHMVSVISNFAQLPVEDRQAVATYIKALPPSP